MVIAVAGTVAVANMSLAAETVSASVAAVMWPSFRSPLLKFVSLSSYFRIDVSLYLFLALSLSLPSLSCYRFMSCFLKISLSLFHTFSVSFSCSVSLSTSFLFWLVACLLFYLFVCLLVQVAPSEDFRQTTAFNLLNLL